MIDWWWSVLLTLVGCLGFWLSGNRNRYGWFINLGSQALWLTYAIVTHQWGFIFGAFLYGSVYLRNYLRWRKEGESDA